MGPILPIAALLSLLVVGSRATTWTVTVKNGGISKDPCTSPDRCSLPGALYAAQFGDNIDITTDVVLAEHLVVNCSTKGLGNLGNLTIDGGDHTVTPATNPMRALSFDNLLYTGEGGGNRYVSIKNLHFKHFLSKDRFQEYLGTVVCAGAHDLCSVGRGYRGRPTASDGDGGAPRSGGREVAAPAFTPNFGLDNVHFSNNTGWIMVDLSSLTNGGFPPLGLVMRNCQFLNNVVGDHSTGSGVVSVWGSATISHSLFQGNLFHDNLIYVNYGDRGGQTLHMDHITASGNTFTGVIKKPDSFAAGYLVNGDDTPVTISHSTFQDNSGALMGIAGRNLTILKTLLHTPPPSSEGYSMLTGHVYLAIGECDISTESLEAFPILSRVAAYNRNPSNLNLTFNGPTPHGCNDLGASPPLGCGSGEPCKDSHNQMGQLVGYSCTAPPN